jgi:hypothetical protein
MFPLASLAEHHMASLTYLHSHICPCQPDILLDVHQRGAETLQASQVHAHAPLAMQPSAGPQK